MELCRRNVEDGIDVHLGDDMLLAGVAREAILKPAGASFDRRHMRRWGRRMGRDGERTARVFRDMAVAGAHRNMQLRDMFYGEMAREVLGEPRIPLGQA